MNPAHLLRAMDVGIRVFCFLAILAQPRLWIFWLPVRGRRGAFFSVRVATDFPASDAGHSIDRQFRARVWSVSATAAAVFAVATFRISSALVPLLFSAATLTVMLASSVVFFLAQRRTRVEAPPEPEPLVRSARLFEEPEPTGWVDVLDWAAILLPLAIPTASILFLIAHQNRLPQDTSLSTLLFQLIFAFGFGLFPATGQFALRFGARSSDWAPTAQASHRYRTMLGLLPSAMFSLIILQLCILTLMRLYHGSMSVYFSFSFPAQALLFVFISRWRSWLKKHFAAESGDQMPDDCWKWGSCYFNRSDPALVVPARSGFAYSFNMARPSLWAVASLLAVVTIVSLVQSVTGLLHISATLPRITH